MKAELEKEPEAPKSVLPRIIITTIVVVGLFFLLKQVWFAVNHEETDNAQVEMRLVPILSRVSGFVAKTYADDYSTVAKGQLLMVIDSAELTLQLQEMQADFSQSLADIENAKASLVNAEASLAASKGNLEVMKQRLSKATIDLSRNTNLLAGSAITNKQFDESQSTFDITTKQLEASRIEVKVASTRLAVLSSLVKKAEAQSEIKKANIDQQRLKLSYCRIYAIADGKLGRRNIDEGEFIQAGTPLLTIVNTQNQWVVANFKESQLKNIHEGQVVNLKIDGDRKLVIKGKVISVSEATGAKFSLLPPDNATGNFVKVTQRVPVRIEIIEGEKYKDVLRAGMSVVVSVPL
jgi:membrane fusion protein, multidrug efflux system